MTSHDASADRAGPSGRLQGLRRAVSRFRPPHILPVAVLLVVFAWLLMAVVVPYFRADERSRASGRLLVYETGLRSEIERFEHLPFVLASDPRVVEVARGGDPAALNARLETFADRAGIEAIYLMDLDGQTIAASNYRDAGSYVGQNYSFRPYFKEAKAGGTGHFFGVGATTRRPGYFIAVPVRDAADSVVGVIAVKVGLQQLETSWNQSGDAILVTNRDGVVVLASQPEWRYRTIDGTTDAQLQRIRDNRQFGGADLEMFGGTSEQGVAVPREFANAIHLTSANLPHGWALHYLADDQEARTRAWLVAAGALVLVMLSLLAAQLLRTARIRRALGRSEAEEASLRRMNERLEHEIEERRAAETRLEQTQSELRRASRLAALGQLAASVNHELAQPLAAMRNQLMALDLARQNAQSDQSAPAADQRMLGRLSSLLDRMEGITRQLKFFSKPGDGMMTRIDLREAVPEALALVQPNIDANEVVVEVNLPETPIAIRGNRLRIEQVLVNLLRNGIDAMEESDDRRLRLDLQSDGAFGRLLVSDSGTGLGDRTMDELAEPFVTSRASGKGMGLGLSISREIVREHGGTLRAWNGGFGDVGAVVEVALPLTLDTEPT
ncbi:ATP-binding protein [Amorphus orientalis]|uniref:histidine kinase n=1 Tax=Amorphus orientalis TaxID=649198 RepID=A0AAE3VLW1_9HYPH|nr:ATP-binding protein [Amorphus orientalis]MDQ0314446.1 two-component system C4-dicarboxylate transport sensor histidine kinase DctB [Amorphus orientalis]